MSNWFVVGKAFLCPSGYSPRIFLNGNIIRQDYEETELDRAHSLLKSLSTWGGYDKNWNGYFGYELPDEQFNAIVSAIHNLLGEPLSKEEEAKILQ